ncbi:MAG TPA: flavin reductase [Pararhizobium sp.]|nr:flavin reductase [Pararhizobium sp.]
MLKRQLIEPKHYRDAMARYAGHVQVVTTADGDKKRGVTVTAACSVSDNPATVLVCLNRSNPRNRIFIDSGVFALNTLAADQQQIAAAFSGETGLTEEERFAVGKWDTIASGAPTLVDAPVVFDCRLIDQTLLATHMVLYGEVVGLRLGEHRRALLYMNRDYHHL